MAEYKVVEIFSSINGEGTRAGRLAVFVRLKGCNLNCSYCDTTWANEENAVYTVMTEQEIYESIKSTGIKNVTITGGEPLFRKDMDVLLTTIAADKELLVEIETNGSVDLTPYVHISDNISFTMDYKLPVSGMEQAMCHSNFSLLKNKDTVKFVAGSREDLDTTLNIIRKYNLQGRVNIYISPVFGKIEPKDIVEYMLANNMNDVNLQLQLHKFIWDPEARGV